MDEALLNGLIEMYYLLYLNKPINNPSFNLIYLKMHCIKAEKALSRGFEESCWEIKVKKSKLVKL